MEISHKLLLLAILSVIAWLVVAVSRLVRHGQRVAQGGMRWREVNHSIAVEESSLPISHLATSVIKRLLPPLCSSVSSVVERFFGLIRGNSRPAVLPLSEERLADPVDGTTFQKGEPIIRCACGAAYHSHSWQWLSQNNGGRCVTCKQAS